MQYHILNGDALKSRFPKTIAGEIVVARACLVDGPVHEESLPKLFALRAAYIAKGYEGYSEQDYYDKTVTEFEKIKDIPENAEVNLWFEEDLFCQVNCWFVMKLLHFYAIKGNVYLVMPPANSPFQFSNVSNEGLHQVFENRIFVSKADQLLFVKLWRAYQKNSINDLNEIFDSFQKQYPFLERAIQAQSDRQAKGEYPGRPKQTLLDIKKELGTNDFGTIFKEFCKREGIYGFGDLQVKRMLEELES